MPNKFVMFFEEITKWVDDGSPVDVIYLDFQKAFDKVPHQRLILKLKSHGMGNSIKKGKGSFYIAQYSVRWTAQSASHFLPSLTDLFIPTPTRLLRKHSSQAAITRQD